MFTGDIDAAQIGFDEGDEQFPARGRGEFERGVGAVFVNRGNGTEDTCGVFHDATDQVLVEIFVLLGSDLFFGWDEDLRPFPRLCGRDGVDSGELKDGATGVIPEPDHVELSFTRRLPEKHVMNEFGAARMGTIDLANEFADPTASAPNPAHGNPGSGGHLFEDLQSKPAIELHSRCTQQRTNGACRTALFTDDFTQVRRCDAEFENSHLFPFHFANIHFIRNIDKRLGDIRN